MSYWGGNRSGENLNCDAEKRDATAASRASSSSSAVKNEEKGGKRQMEIERGRERERSGVDKNTACYYCVNLQTVLVVSVK